MLSVDVKKNCRGRGSINREPAALGFHDIDQRGDSYCRCFFSSVFLLSTILHEFVYWFCAILIGWSNYLKGPQNVNSAYKVGLPENMLYCI